MKHPQTFVNNMQHFLIFDIALFNRHHLKMREVLLMNYLIGALNWTKQQNEWFYLSRNKILNDLPNFYKNAIALRRSLAALKKAGLILTHSFEHKDWFQLTELGKECAAPVEALNRGMAKKACAYKKALVEEQNTRPESEIKPNKNTISEPIMNPEDLSPNVKNTVATGAENDANEALFLATEQQKNVHAHEQKMFIDSGDTYIYNNNNNTTPLTGGNARTHAHAPEEKRRRFFALAEMTAAGVSEENARAWLDVRAEHKKRLTANAWKRVVKAVNALQDKGARFELNDAVALMAERGWLSISADWDSVQRAAFAKKKKGLGLNPRVILTDEPKKEDEEFEWVSNPRLLKKLGLEGQL